MPKLHKIYILLGLTLILTITTFAAVLPYLTSFLMDRIRPALASAPRSPAGFRPPPAPQPTLGKQTPPLAARFDLNSEPGKFEHRINQLLMTKDFAQIDQIAREVRLSKKRFVNGKWAIHRLYDGLTTIYQSETEQYQTDALWRERIELLKSWKKDFPASVTPRIALAATYISYGWFARGEGYISTVSEENRALLSERLTMAEKELLAARTLEEKCPEWYVNKLFLAQVTNASDEEFEALFNEAIDFEPNFYPFYSIKSDHLTPKWGGSKAKWQKYVDSIPEIAARHDSDEGGMLYLLVVIESMRDNAVVNNYSVFSKATLRQGFDVVSQKHGIDYALLNEYAYLSIMVLDIPAAKEALKKIGDNPDPQTWSKEKFYAMKKFAESDELKNLPEESL